ncbi:MAG: HEAT repeat domain-containing protein [Planctomycetes bacterium]|nr:HEAT repeat domain-containing protein [Planctomycetota bacterium]
MQRILILALLSFASVLSAGDFEADVKDLGDSIKRTAAIERLAKAGADAFDDLLDGLKQDPDAAGINAEEKAARSTRRLECARLLGALGDTRAAATLNDVLKANAVDKSNYPLLAGACASALGRIYSDESASAERGELVNELKRITATETMDTRIRWGALHGLAALREGADVAAPILADAAKPVLLRVAAIGVLTATKHMASADTFLDLWETQRLGVKDAEGKRAGALAKDYGNPLGLTALFGLAELADARAVPGLVDVATMSEFAGLVSLRGQSIRLMQRDAIKQVSLDALIAVFKDETRTVQHQRAAQTMGEFGAAGVTAFLAVADSAVPEGKAATYWSDLVDRHLASLNSEDALKAFVAAYRTLGSTEEKDKKLRGKVIDHLLNYRTSLKTDGINLVKEAADDTTLDVPKRAQCINAYAESRGKDSFADLERWVKSEDGVIRAQAVQNLGRSYIPLKKSKDLLVAAAKSAGTEFAKARQNALQGLQRSEDKELLPLFLDALSPEKEPDAEVRNAALSAIDTYRRSARIKDEDVFPAIKARLGDPDANVRAAAIKFGVITAQRMGENKQSVEMVERGLTDDKEEVRSAAYAQVTMVATDIDASKVVDAALKEDSQKMQGEAVRALGRLDKWGEADKRRKVLDLALSMLANATSEYDAGELIKKVAANDGANFNYVSGEVRKRVDTLTTGAVKEHHRVPLLIDVLIAIKDDGYAKRIQELAEEPNVQLRRKCVDYIVAFGVKRDVDWLRKLRDRTDSTAEPVRSHIDEAIRKLEER